ncbi:hypothetical protein NQ315_014941 [Exocentrus adspersus]|uniref:DNA-directed DNA polymerase n=1 Tax=Exocentrus adspersus TaxID=1586481 RepID=A0AAV8VAL5_9CUCU|nr:hypothetical protein NQ315_014941 [Exocentrus adspersus]
MLGLGRDVWELGRWVKGKVGCDSKLPKLMTTLNLKQALSFGIKVTKIHRVLQFNQSPWLKSYIDLNSKLRAQVKNSEKNLYKLMNNAVFGTTMENIRKHRTVKLKNHWGGRYGASNYIASPNFHSRAIFDTDLVAIELNKAEICFYKPLYVGMCILDLSKTCVYDFHYNFLCKKMISTTVKYYIPILIINLISASSSIADYAADNPYQLPLVNKKVLGLMKDEYNGAIMTHFFGLRSKMYSILIEGKQCIKKSKGVKSNVDYENCFKNSVEIYRTQRTIQSKLHNLYNVEQSKIALSPHDDKRHLFTNDEHDTLPWSHYSIDDISDVI